ncbi:conserved hypothetical protein, secreted [Candidatus Magnetomorum sp. HK-1]|nr:conserved hypothetical protein, secreted [Candidatus Magnetomorum sp. HK-1]
MYKKKFLIIFLLLITVNNLAFAKNLCEITLDQMTDTLKINSVMSISGSITSSVYNGDLTDLPILVKLTNPNSTEELIETKTFQGRFITDHTFNLPGIWSIQACLSENNVYTPVSSEIKQIDIVHNSGYTIIISANRSNRNNIQAFNRTTQHVYQSLKYRGFLDEDILFFNEDTNIPGVDYSTNKKMIQDVLSGTNDVVMDNSDLNIQEKMNQNPANLYIIITGYGDSDLFYIHPDIAINASEFASWLHAFQFGTEKSIGLTGNAFNKKIIIILGFSHSGSFIDDLSGTNRVIITSCQSNEIAYMGSLDIDGIREGDFFISELFKNILPSNTVRKAFIKTAYNIGRYTFSSNGIQQKPLFDDDGDKAGQTDISLFKPDDENNTYLYVGSKKNTTDQVLEIDATKSISLGNQSITLNSLYAQLTGVSNPNTLSVWIEIKAPDFAPEQPDNNEPVKLKLPQIYGQKCPNTPNCFQWQNINTFTGYGTYQVFYFTSGNQAPLAETKVYKIIPENSEPLPFTLLSPENNSEVNLFHYSPDDAYYAILDWEDAVDPEGHDIQYRVFLSPNVSFPYTQTLTKENIENSNCMIAIPDNLLRHEGIIYWYVQAIDEYGAIQTTKSKFFTIFDITTVTAYIKGNIYRAGTTQPITNAVFSIPAFDCYANSNQEGSFMKILPIRNNNDSCAISVDVRTTAQGYLSLENIINIPESCQIDNLVIELEPATTRQTFVFHLKKGWNLVSLPIIPDSFDYMTIFPDAISIYRYENGRYIEEHEIKPEVGYWVELDSDKTYEVTGLPKTNYTKSLSSGWHLLGATFEKTTPMDNNEVCIDIIYAYDEGDYHKVFELTPGFGYWIYLVEKCEFIINN